MLSFFTEMRNLNLLVLPNFQYAEKEPRIVRNIFKQTS